MIEVGDIVKFDTSDLHPNDALAFEEGIVIKIEKAAKMAVVKPRYSNINWSIFVSLEECSLLENNIFKIEGFKI